MAYVHSSAPQISLYNLNTVMLDESGRAKLCDFSGAAATAKEHGRVGRKVPTDLSIIQ